MNIEQANTIPMSEFLKKLNVLPYRDYQCSALYKAPHRSEKTASFRVSKTKNVWFDHGTGKGGNLFSFVIEYLKSQKEDHTASDALRFINNIWNNAPISSLPELDKDQEKDESKLKLLLITSLNHTALIRYIEDRSISMVLAKLYFKQAQVKNENTGKTFNTIALKNEADGYELSNRLFKGSVNGKDMSLIRGTDPYSGVLHLYEGKMDFVSVLTRLKTNTVRNDVIVLNSLSMLQKAKDHIQYTNDLEVVNNKQSTRYETIYSWFDNDNAGELARKSLDEFLKTVPGIIHRPMNAVYKGYKDVNEWHIANPVPSL